MGMKRVLMPLAAAALFFTVAPAAADTKSDIQKLYNKLCTAFKNGDMKLLMSTAAPGFKMKQQGQTMNAEQARAHMEAMFKSGVKINRCTMKVESIKLKGNTATVKALSHTDALMPGPPGGKKMRMVSDGVSRDILVKTPQGWKFKFAETVSEKMTMDGRPFDPSMMAPPPTKK